MEDTTVDVTLDSLLQALPACKRCRECKRGCDTLLPACLQCQKAGVDCVFFDHVLNEFLPRSYIASLVQHVANASGPKRPAKGSGVLSKNTNSMFVTTGNTYRFLGGASCLSMFSLQENGDLENEVLAAPALPQLDRKLLSALRMPPELCTFLGQRYLEQVENYFPVLRPATRAFVSYPATQLGPVPLRLVVYMVQSIACQTLFHEDPQWNLLENFCWNNAMTLLEASTTEAGIETLEITLLLALHSLGAPDRGNIHQQLGLASRLAIDLATHELAEEDSEALRNMTASIFCLENEISSTLDRPATFAEPIGDLDFAVSEPPKCLCSLYKMRRQFRRTKDATLGQPLPENLSDSGYPLLDIALAQTRFMVEPNASNGARLLSTLHKNSGLETFLMPHWTYCAAAAVLNERKSINPLLALRAFGDASSLLTRYARRWSAVGKLLQSLRHQLEEVEEQGQTDKGIV